MKAGCFGVYMLASNEDGDIIIGRGIDDLKEKHELILKRINHCLSNQLTRSYFF